MKNTYRIDQSIFIPAPLDEVWERAATPSGLVELTPKIFCLVLQEPGEIRVGARLKLGLKIPRTEHTLDWIAHIVECVSQGDRRHFVDVQEKGPFAFYRHEHVFEKGQGGTWVRDVVDFESPLWAPSIVATTSLTQLVRGRHESLQKRALV
jgi:ligand-binding SRPBCC domain-containing protein